MSILCRANDPARASVRYRPAILLLVAASALPLGACAAEAPDPEALYAPGRQRVGFRQSTLTYARAGTGEPRTLPLSIWYPAEAGDEGSLAIYVTAGVIRIPSETALVEPRVASGGPFPLVVYSHGGGGEAQHVYPYAELLASHGFVVVSPDHVGTTTRDTGDSFAPLERWALDRPSDISATLDWLESPTDSFMAGLAATDRVLLIGYSLGGYTALATAGATLDLDAIRDRCSVDCALLADGAALASAYRALVPDARLVALVTQAPGALDIFVPESPRSVDMPVLLQNGLLDVSVPTDTSAVPLFMGRQHPEDIWLEMAQGAHMSFIPTCRDVALSLVELVRPTAPNDGCGDRFIPIDDALETLAAYTLGFARLHLLGEAKWGAVLSGPPLRPGFTVTTR